MKKRGILLGLSLAAALTAACSRTPSTDHSKMNHDSMNHNSAATNTATTVNSNASTMNHNSMSHSNMQTDAGAVNAPYDLQFIDTMIHHHDGAVEMAEMALQKTENAELKIFAEKIISDQKRENQELADWRKQWFGDAPAAKNMQLRGMADSMKAMTPDHMKMMRGMSGAAFDTHFLDMMIPHHRGAVEMAREALEKGRKPEIKKLAGEIIEAQEAEIKQMNEWKAKWTK